MTEVQYKSEFEFTKDTPKLALMCQLCGVYYEDLGDNWPRYNDIALYVSDSHVPW